MVTIKQIAQEVGISSSTVSIVLGGKAAERKISTATQEKIFAAAARLGYQPKTILTVLDEIPTSCAICLIVTMLFPTFF